MAITALPIDPVQTVSGQQFQMVSTGEKATQTFKTGTVVALSTGYVAAWGGASPSDLPVIYGIAAEAASNLTTAATAKTTTEGSVVNEASAVNIPPGARLNDGKIRVYRGNLDTIFAATFGNNGAAATIAVTDVGTYYGLTIDSGSNYWYVDKNKSTAATNTAVKVVGIDPLTSRNGTSIDANSRALFIFREAVLQ